MKYNIGDIICWTYSGDELSTIIEHYIDWEEKDIYVLITYHRNAKEYLRDNLSEEEMDRFIQGKVIKHYPIK